MSGPIHRLTAAATIAGGLLVLATTIASGQQTPVRAVPDAFARGVERQVGPIHIVPIRRDRIYDRIYLMASAEGNSAQGAPSASRGATARASAPFDMTGYWVSVVTEDWRWRMMTPPRATIRVCR